MINSILDTCNCLVANDSIDLTFIALRSPFVKMHAEYNESKQYLPHRTVQSYQLSQFIQHLTQPTDAVIVCGDMNCEPSQLCYRVIKDVTGLVDAWDKHGKVKVIPRNLYMGQNVSTTSNVIFSNFGVMIDLLACNLCIIMYLNAQECMCYDFFVHLFVLYSTVHISLVFYFPTNDCGIIIA